MAQIRVVVFEKTQKTHI